jgi:hypothetical protein
MKLNAFALSFVAVVILGTAVADAGGRSEKNPAPTGRLGNQPLYEGNGAKGVRVAVLEPRGSNIPNTKTWLLNFIQGSLTGDFQRFSAMTVTDRQNLDRIVTEQKMGETGYFSEDNFAQIGNLTNAQYILAGSLTNAEGSYILELGITEVNTGERRASFSPRRYPAADIESLAAVKEATEDLLTQMGVTLTPAGRTALRSRAQESAVKAETALSKGIGIQKSGNTAAALMYYSDAAAFDPNLIEAGMRLSTLKKQISSATLGDEIRNDIQRRNAWKKLLDDAIAFCEENPPFNIVYNPAPQQGVIDYDRGTVTIGFSLWLAPNARFEALRNIVIGAVETGKLKEWGMEEYRYLPFHSASNQGTFLVTAELLDASGNLLGKGSTDRLHTFSIKEYQSADYFIVVPLGTRLEFKVDANKITEKMSLSFTEVNSVPESSRPTHPQNLVENTAFIATTEPVDTFFSRAYRTKDVRLSLNGSPSVNITYNRRVW